MYLNVMPANTSDMKDNQFLRQGDRLVHTEPRHQYIHAFV
jgi:hypothetical protein